MASNVGGVNFQWYEKEVMNAAKIELGKVTKKVAAEMLVESRRVLIQKAKTTTEMGLKSQFSLQPSRFKDGGIVVWCQGPNKWRKPYHASFMELGTYKDDAKPFMRPTRKKFLKKAKKYWQEALDKL